MDSVGTSLLYDNIHKLDTNMYCAQVSLNLHMTIVFGYVNKSSIWSCPIIVN